MLCHNNYCSRLLYLATWDLPQEHSDVADADVGSYVFNDLVQANDAASSSITSVQQLGKPLPLSISGIPVKQRQQQLTACDAPGRAVCCRHTG
jgi:hypothetical protein